MARTFDLYCDTLTQREYERQFAGPPEGDDFPPGPDATPESDWDMPDVDEDGDEVDEPTPILPTPILPTPDADEPCPF